MAEPGADRVEVDPGLKQVTGARVADDVGRDPPCGKRWHTGRTALDEPVDPEARIGSSQPAEEYGIASCASPHESRERAFGARPQGALTELPALAVDVDERVPALQPNTGFDDNSGNF